jgi:Zn-dependent peptidase ImmA (M78 family)
MRKGSANTIRERAAVHPRRDHRPHLPCRCDRPADPACGWWASNVIEACTDHDVRYSITVRRTKPVRRQSQQSPRRRGSISGYTPRRARYRLHRQRSAQVAETLLAGWRLVVWRTRTTGKQRSSSTPITATTPWQRAGNAGWREHAFMDMSQYVDTLPPSRPGARMSRKLEIPVTVAALEQAMREAGVGAQELASLLNIEPGDVEAWVSGHDRPGKTQLRKLSRQLRKPPSYFLLEDPPPRPALPVAFRGEAGWRATRELLQEEAEALQQASKAQKIVGWIRERTGNTPASLPRIDPKRVDGEEAGELLRESLGWDTRIQRQAQSDSAAANEFRFFLEDRGLLVLHLNMTDDGCRGFSLWHDTAPLIAVNTRQNTGARLFTYVHELAHLASRSDSICVGFAPDRTVERWAEEVAAAFLMPRSDFLEAFQYHSSREGDNYIEIAKRISSRFKTSLRSSALRMAELGLTEQNLYQQIDRTFESSSSGGFNPDPTAPGNRLREWGFTYAKELLSAEQAGHLRRSDVLAYLHLSDKEVREVEHRLEARGAL